VPQSDGLHRDQLATVFIENDSAGEDLDRRLEEHQKKKKSRIEQEIKNSEQCQRKTRRTEEQIEMLADKEV
jgi:hypothetical protein